MAGEEVGDTTQLRLRVTPADATTAAVATVTSPSGVVSTPTATPDADRANWAAPLVLGEAGAWAIRWVVTGVGAGVQTYTISVAPSGAVLGRLYATTAQLAAYTGQAPPPGAARLLRKASRIVDDMLRCAVYAVDLAGKPTDPAVADALAEATCAQVAWWDEIGDDQGSGAVSALAGAQIGSVKLPGGGGGAGAGGVPNVAPDAARALSQAGLLNRGPYVPGPGRPAWSDR